MNLMFKHLQMIFLLILFSILCNAQHKNLPDPEAYFIAIIVEDMDLSIDWYKNVFGFSEIDRYENSDRGLRQANLKRAAIHIELIEIKGSVGNEDLLADYPSGYMIKGYFKFGIKVSEFDKWMLSFEELKVDIHGSVVTDSISMKRMIIIKDPDGNRIQVFEK